MYCPGVAGEHCPGQEETTAQAGACCRVAYTTARALPGNRPLAGKDRFQRAGTNRSIPLRLSATGGQKNLHFEKETPITEKLPGEPVMHASAGANLEGLGALHPASHQKRRGNHYGGQQLRWTQRHAYSQAYGNHLNQAPPDGKSRTLGYATGLRPHAQHPATGQGQTTHRLPARRRRPLPQRQIVRQTYGQDIQGE